MNPDSYQGRLKYFKLFHLPERAFNRDLASYGLPLIKSQAQ